MSKQLTRRNFLLKTGSALAVSSFGFPSVILPKKKSRLGVALVGLGNYSTNWVAPGLLETQHCELRGIVTGTPEKIPVWQESYGIPDQNVYDYENMHTMADNPDIDIVYIVLPNHLHAEYSTGLEPVAVSAIQRTDRTEMFPEVDEHTDFKLEFPGGIIATCECSFGKNMDYLHIDCTEGWYRLSPFQSFRGVRGETSDGIELSVDPTHHQARQMDNDALAIKENKPPVVPGEDGLADIRIVEGIFKSARLGGEWVEL